MTPEVSIIMGAKGRPVETRRTLQSYAKLSHKNWELLFMNVIDYKPDEDDLCGLYREFKDILPIRYFPVLNSHTPAQTWNLGMTHAEGKFWITCSADLLMSYPDLIEKYLDQYNNVRISTLTYFLTRYQTKMLDTIEWNINPESIRQMEGFWGTTIQGENNTQRTLAGLTTYQTGMSAERWKWFGKFRTEYSHLVNDQDIHMREKALEVGCDTLQDYWAIHQAHPVSSYNVQTVLAPGWHYANKLQARLLDPAERDAE